MRQFIGIMLNDFTYQRIPFGQTSHEQLPFYEEAGNHYGLIPCYFRMGDIEPGMKQIQAFVMDKDQRYKIMSVPTPKVIHNRSYSRENGPHKRKIERLMEEGIVIFNLWTRYDKLRISNLLMQYDHLQPFLPDTLAATPTHIFEMLNRYDSLIVKPSFGSLGSGIMKIEKKGKEYLLNHLTKGLKITFSEELPALFLKEISARLYIVQEFIPLLTFEGRPFDLRVSVQRNGTGSWQVTGICGKAAKMGSFVTNVATGGSIFVFEELLRQSELNAEIVKKNTEKVAIQFAKALGNQLEGLADVGFDIGLRQNGEPVLIECNFKDLRYSFRLANMLEEWKQTYFNPVAYGRYIYDRLW
jgi:glutathione synthase/RimK-type ligase-like ATP-grasp enzyme